MPRYPAPLHEVHSPSSGASQLSREKALSVQPNEPEGGYSGWFSCAECPFSGHWSAPLLGVPPREDDLLVNPGRSCRIVVFPRMVIPGKVSATRHGLRLALAYEN